MHPPHDTTQHEAAKTNLAISKTEIHIVNSMSSILQTRRACYIYLALTVTISNFIAEIVHEVRSVTMEISFYSEPVKHIISTHQLSRTESNYDAEWKCVLLEFRRFFFTEY